MSALHLLLEYLIEQVTIGLLYVRIIFAARILYRGVPSFAADCLCGVLCHGLATCLLYVGSLFGLKIIFKWQLDFKFDITEYTFSLLLIIFMHCIWLCLNISWYNHTMFLVSVSFTSQMVLYFLPSTAVLSVSIGAVLALSTYLLYILISS